MSLGQPGLAGIGWLTCYRGSGEGEWWTARCALTPQGFTDLSATIVRIGRVDSRRRSNPNTIGESRRILLSIRVCRDCITAIGLARHSRRCCCRYRRFNGLVRRLIRNRRRRLGPLNHRFGLSMMIATMLLLIRFRLCLIGLCLRRCLICFCLIPCARGVFRKNSQAGTAHAGTGRMRRFAGTACQPAHRTGRYRGEWNNTRQARKQQHHGEHYSGGADRPDLTLLKPIHSEVIEEPLPVGFRDIGFCHATRLKASFIPGSLRRASLRDRLLGYAVRRSWNGVRARRDASR